MMGNELRDGSDEIDSMVRQRGTRALPGTPRIFQLYVPVYTAATRMDSEWYNLVSLNL